MYDLCGPKGSFLAKGSPNDVLHTTNKPFKFPSLIAKFSTYRDGPDHFCTCHLGAVFGTTPAGSAARRRPAIAGQCRRARGGFTS